MTGTWTISGGLRVAAVLGFALAGLSYMVDGWRAADFLQRQLLWAAATVALSGLGVFCIKQLREPNSARTFLGLSAATLPAHFAQLGAAVFAYVAFEGPTASGELWIAASIVFTLGLPLSLGLSALARRDARLLTLWLLLLCSPLLVPTRHGDHVTLLATLDLLLFLALEHRVFRRDAIYRSTEGIAIRSLLAAPSVILMSRNFYYESTPLWTAGLCALPALALLSFVPLLPARLRAFAVGVSLLAFATSGAIIAPTLAILCWTYALVSVPAALLVDGRAASATAVIGLLALSGCVLVNCWDPSTWATLLLLPVGTLQALSAYQRRSLLQLGMATLATGVGVLAPLFGHLHFSLPSLWLPGLIGSAALLLLASLLDQNRATIQRLFIRLQAHFAAKDPRPERPRPEQPRGCLAAPEE